MGAERLLVTDLDGTLIGDDRALERFAAWHGAKDDGTKLVYATGRSIESVERSIASTSLPRPDATITSVGTEIRDGRGRQSLDWPGRGREWDAGPVRRLLSIIDRLKVQPESLQSRYKASFDAPDLADDDVDGIRRLLADAGLAATVVYSSSLHLDILPPWAGKGDATVAIADSLGIGRRDVLVFGDSGNDLQLFQRGFCGTIVANALPELRSAVDETVYRSPLPFADGVLDGIRYWSIRQPAQPTAASNPAR
jgi:sucrose-6F-phosphate phosphohydrolase